MLKLIAVMSMLTVAHGYRILCMQTMPMRSHYILMRSIVDILLEAGHEITFVTTYPESNPVDNLTLVDISHVKSIIDDIDLTDRSRMKVIKVTDVARTISRAVVESDRVRDLVMKGIFDAVVTERFHSDLEAGYAALLQAPWIVLSSTSLIPHTEYMVDAVRSTPPTFMSATPIPMNFFERLLNTYNSAVNMFTILSELWITGADYEKYFQPLASAKGVQLPPFYEAIYNISILLVNSHPAVSHAKSLPPNVVDIAGYHVRDVPPLPQDLQEILDSSPQGVIYFSMGSALRSAGFPDKARNELVQLFGSLPYTVLWKYEGTLQDIPKNLHIRPWMPQASILSHPNVKTFITHGGLLGAIEGILHGVPFIVVPVFGDQPRNAARFVGQGIAIKVDFSPDMAGGLRVALEEMTSNDSYTRRAKTLSAVFRDRPVAPGELVQHYIELAIKSKGAYHLRSTSHLYSWYQLWMLDQAVAFLLVVFVISMVIKKIKQPEIKQVKPKKIKKK